MNVVLLLAAMVWQVDEGWVEDGVGNWELNASGAWSYSIEGSFEAEFIEAALLTRWRQDLNGSNSNNSSLEMTVTTDVIGLVCQVGWSRKAQFGALSTQIWIVKLEI